MKLDEFLTENIGYGMSINRLMMTFFALLSGVILVLLLWVFMSFFEGHNKVHKLTKENEVYTLGHEVQLKLMEEAHMSLNCFPIDEYNECTRHYDVAKVQTDNAIKRYHAIIDAIEVKHEALLLFFHEFKDYIADLKSFREQFSQGVFDHAKMNEILDSMNQAVTSISDELLISEEVDVMVRNYSLKYMHGLEVLYKAFTKKSLLLADYINHMSNKNHAALSEGYEVRYSLKEIDAMMIKLDRQVSKILRVLDPKERSLMLSAHGQLKQVVENYNAAQQEVYNQISASVSQERLDELRHVSIEFKEKVESLGEILSRPVTSALHRAHDNSFYAIVILAIVACIVLVFVILSFVLIKNRALIPVRKITERMEKMAQGQVGVDLPETKYEDEIGRMVEALRVFKRNAEDIHETAKRLELAEEISNLGYWKIDLEKNTLYWSQEVYRVHGLSPYVFRPTVESAIALYHDDDKEYVAETVQHAMDEGKDFRFERRIIRPDGEIRYVETRGGCEFDEEGKVVGLFGTFLDITERKLQEEELDKYSNQLEELVEERSRELLVAKEDAEAANVAKSEFVSNMSHELRTPMHAILNFSKMSIKKIEKGDTTKVPEYLGSVVASGERLLNLLNAVLDLSKLESGRANMSFEADSMLDRIEQAQNELKSLFAEKNIKYELINNVENDEVEMDGLAIVQVLVNLISNALKFSPSKGTVAIHLDENRFDALGNLNDSIVVSVCDDGVGIPEEELESVFDRFVQSSKTKSGAGGTGLGLSICYAIIQSHQGKIWAENCPKGGGALFKFSIPIKQSDM